MRLTEPRVPPVAAEDWDEAQAKVMQPFAAQGRVFNVFATMVNHPDLFRRWLVFANHVLGKSTLSVRDRELLILRIAFLCQSEYEWGQHVEIARAAEMSDADIETCRAGPDSPGIGARDALLLRATDELHADTMIADPTWQGLARHYDTRQIMDIVFTVGQYNMLAMALNSLGVQLDPGLEGF